MAANNFKWSDPGQHSHFLFFFLHFNKNCQQCFINIQSYPKFCNQFPSFWNPRIADLNQPTCVRLNYQLGLFYHWSNFWGSIVGIPAAQCKLISHQSSKKTLQFFSVKSWFWENPPPCTMVHARILSTYRRSIKEGLWKNHPPRYQPPFWFTKLISILVI